MISRGREYLKGHLGEALNSPETHAYMVYALASTGGVPKAGDRHGLRAADLPESRAHGRSWRWRCCT